MSATAPPRPLLGRLPFYYGWVMVVLASVAMTATLPGRTHGLGLVAKPIESDAVLPVDEHLFNRLNLGAILLGALMCLPVGWLIDRYGVRPVLVGVCAGLGGSVLLMSAAADLATFFIALTLVRGFGQGALSVVSMAMIGKWFTRRLGLAMGVFTVLLAFGFIATTLGVTDAVDAYGWRATWNGIAVALFAFAVVGGLLVRSTPEAAGVPVEAPAVPEPAGRPDDWTAGQALRLPAFWAFALSAALFNLVWSAITLQSQNLLEAQGFTRAHFRTMMAMLVFAGLPANLLCGWLARSWPMSRLLVLGMVVFAGSLVAFPSVATEEHVLAYGVGLGFAGGVITVVFFAVYGKAFGRTHLGSIQAVVQVISVVASAVGPELLGLCKRTTGGYSGFFYAAAPAALALGLAAWLLPLPRRGGERV